jgi:hypothetical protein
MLAALSAAMVVPRRRIGFLFETLHIRRREMSISRDVDMVLQPSTCQPHLIGRALRVSDVFDKIKTEFLKEQNK